MHPNVILKRPGQPATLCTPPVASLQVITLFTASATVALHDSSRLLVRMALDALDEMAARVAVERELGC